MSTDDLIKEYEGRLEIGMNKLLDLEAKGEWNDKMFSFWKKLEHTYMLLCKGRDLEQGK